MSGIRGQPGALYRYDRDGRRVPVVGRRIFIDGVPVYEPDKKKLMALFREAQRQAAAQNLQALVRPLKPPARRA